ncbi:hypothetical protein M9H77_36494 [Catharanthus roseus]|uniref:Uncharacterized protein n=1 Tax=Catharanthus roseus TaxID=4058 RepID=A0ACB9ZTS8_CATRO|nr:hypothetical protein M9H77_36494 [Catharanthus roseus]
MGLVELDDVGSIGWNEMGSAGVELTEALEGNVIGVLEGMSSIRFHHVSQRGRLASSGGVRHARSRCTAVSLGGAGGMELDLIVSLGSLILVVKLKVRKA